MELTLEESLQKAVEAHQAGQTQEAERLYNFVLNAQPNHPDANHNMGVLVASVNKMEDALAYFKIALEADPSINQYWLSCIKALIKLDKLDDAKSLFNQAKDKGAKGEAFEQIEKRLSELSVGEAQSQDPDPPSEQLQPIISLYTQGHLQQALSEISQMLERFPNSAILYNIAGSSNVGLMQLDIAINSYKQALQLRPNYAEVYRNMGDALKLSGDLEAAIDSYKKAVLIKPDFAVAYDSLGMALKDKGDLEVAIDSYKQAVIAEPDFVNAYNNMGVALQEKGDLDAAIDSYKQAIKIKLNFAEAYNNMGNALQDKGDLEAAIDSYKKAVLIKPDFAVAYNSMGMALKDKGDLEVAIDSYKQAVIAEPDFVNAYNNMGVALQEKGDLDAAINSYKQALKIRPNSSEAHNNMGVALQNKGDLEAAIGSYQQAIKINPDLARAYNNIGLSMRSKGDLEAAIDSYKKAIKINPDYAEAYNNMGVVLENKGDLEAAIDSYKQAIKINPDYAEAYNNMGVSLQYKGDLKAAIDSYKQALIIKPDYSEAHNNMGVTLYENGDLLGTIGAYRQALKIEPNSAKIWNSLQFPLQSMKFQIPARDGSLSMLNPQVDSKHFQIAKSVLNYRLHLGEANAERYLNEASSLLSTLDNAIIRNPNVTNDEPHLKPIGPDKIVALVHFGRSGTGLLHSLIDGHPEVSTLPSYYFSEFFNPSTWEKIVAGGWSEMADRFIATYEVLFDASVRNLIVTKSKKTIDYMGQKEGMANVGDKRDEVLRVDKALFREELNCLMSVHNHLDAFAFFQLVHSAYDKSLNDVNHKHLNFYHIHNPSPYAQLNFVHVAPNTNWVMMVREPLQACESWIKTNFHNDNYAEISVKVFTMLFEIDSVIYQKQNSIGVRLEDLKESPQKTISALCDWMGIEETESLYEMTAQGKKWWGDPESPDYSKDGMEPFGTNSIKREVGSVFTENDQFIMRTLFYPFSFRFGYVEENLKQFKADLQAIRPMLDEMFGFEKTMSERTQVDAEQFMKSGSYLYLRSGLIERWNVLAEFHTYPNMIKPLNIN